MVRFSATALLAIAAAVKAGLKNCITSSIDGESVRKKFQSRACCTCDKLLTWADTNTISVEELKRLEWVYPDMSMKSEVIRYYTYEGRGFERDTSLSRMLLSPKAVWHPCNRGGGCFELCCECNEVVQRKSKKVKTPETCIGRYGFGGAPEELKVLNDVELALVAQGRIDRHIFSAFAGQHKCIKLWHQLFFSDVEHTKVALERFDVYKAPNEIICTLAGPFTIEQRAKTFDKITVNRQRVIRALKWLVENNRLYAGMKIDNEIQFPDPVIVDHSEIVEGGGSVRVETVFESTAIFPQINSVTPEGAPSREEYLKNVLESKQFHHEHLMIHRPTATAIKAFEGDNLIRCFPLQFPFGFGSRQPGISLPKYIKYLAQLSIPSFQKGDFLLVLFNIFCKNNAVVDASIKCKYRVDDDTSASDFISGVEIEDVLDNLRDIENDKSGNLRSKSMKVRQLLHCVSAVCKTLPFTDEAAKEERKKMFAMCTRFGLPAVFFRSLQMMEIISVW